MDPDSVQIAARGAWGTIEWAIDVTGEMPARDFYLKLPEEDTAKVTALFRRLADFGVIRNREKFRQLGKKAGPRASGIWEFKSFQIRFLGDFRPGKRLIVAHGTRKKKDELPRSDIEKAMRILGEHDAREGGVR